MDEKTYKTLFVELQLYEQSEVRMMLENHPASPMQIVSAHMVKEDSVYMRDYVWDDKGQIKELVFHNIKDN